MVNTMVNNHGAINGLETQKLTDNLTDNHWFKFNRSTAFNQVLVSNQWLPGLQEVAVVGIFTQKFISKNASITATFINPSVDI